MRLQPPTPNNRQRPVGVLLLIGFICVTFVFLLFIHRRSQPDDALEPSMFDRLLLPSGARSAGLPHTRILVVLAIGGEHATTIRHTIDRFLADRKVELKMILYLYDQHDWGDALVEWNSDVRITVMEEPKRILKLEFARTFLAPEFVEGFDYLFLWDGDGVLSSKWSPSRYIETMKSANLDISQPSLADGSQRSYAFNYEPFLETNFGSKPWSPALYAEIGFIVYRVNVWQRIWTHILKPHNFLYWCFDALPFQCLREINATVGIIRQPIYHPSGRHVLGIQVKQQSPEVTTQIQYEKRTARMIVACSSCCQFIERMTNPTNNNGCFPKDEWECPECDNGNGISRLLSRLDGRQ